MTSKSTTRTSDSYARTVNQLMLNFLPWAKSIDFHNVRSMWGEAVIKFPRGGFTLTSVIYSTD